MSKIEIYEPAMCCDTGLCGVSVDPDLLRISTVANTLKNNGITVSRYNLTSSPSEFVKNKEINATLNTEGISSLPITVVNGSVMKKGGYPTNEDITAWLQLSNDVLLEESNQAEESCGCCGDGCC